MFSVVKSSHSNSVVCRCSIGFIFILFLFWVNSINTILRYWFIRKVIIFPPYCMIAHLFILNCKITEHIHYLYIFTVVFLLVFLISRVQLVINIIVYNYIFISIIQNILLDSCIYCVLFNGVWECGHCNKFYSKCMSVCLHDMYICNNNNNWNYIYCMRI